MTTNTLNPGLAVVAYLTFDGSFDAVCFIGDLGQDVTVQAAEYLRHESIDYSDFRAYWHNALEDVYGNRYEPGVKLIG